MNDLTKYIEEASNPNTTPGRLDFLASSYQPVSVRAAAIRNPSYSESSWRKVFLDGDPEAWDSHHALLWLFDENDLPSTFMAARQAYGGFLQDPSRCSPEALDLIRGSVDAWWSQEQDAKRMTVWVSFVFGKKGSRHNALSIKLIDWFLDVSIEISKKIGPSEKEPILETIFSVKDWIRDETEPSQKHKDALNRIVLHSMDSLAVESGYLAYSSAQMALHLLDMAGTEKFGVASSNAIRVCFGYYSIGTSQFYWSELADIIRRSIPSIRGFL